MISGKILRVKKNTQTDLRRNKRDKPEQVSYIGLPVGRGFTFFQVGGGVKLTFVKNIAVYLSISFY